MGFLDVILGSSKLPPPKLDRLFAISTASVTLEVKLGLRPSGAAGVCIKPMESSAFDRARQEIGDLLKISAKETGTKYELLADQYGYLWVVMKDPDFDDLVANVQMVSQTLTEQGFGPQLLCAVYGFEGQGKVYLIFSFKLGAYYPFAPLSGNERDNARELRLKMAMEGELPIEKDVEKWYPLWGMPF